MERATPIVRIILGLLFLVSGLNGFLQILPNPTFPEAATQFLGALGATGYLFYLLKVTELFCGLALLVNRFVPLALTVLAPIVVNIAAFHLFLAPKGLPIAVFLVGAEIFLAYAYCENFEGIGAKQATPWLCRRDKTQT